MDYLKQVDAWLEEIGITTVETRKAIKDKILESYRNGQKQGGDDTEAYHMGRIEVAEVIMEFAEELKQDSEKQIHVEPKK